MTSHRSSLTLNGFEVIFELVFQVQVVREHFHTYLKSTLNEEGFLFCEQVTEYKKILPGATGQMDMAKNITDTFIREGSRSEVNIEGELRNSVIKQLEGAKETASLPAHLFDEIYRIVFRELKEDGFPRYIRSDEFTKFIASQGDDILPLIAINLGVASPRNAVRFQPKDLTSGTISDKDVKFVLRLNSDTSDWQRIYEGKDGSSTFISRTNYSIGGMRELKLGKITGYLPCSAEEAAAMDTMDEVRHVFDSNLRENEYITTIKAGDNNDNPYTSTVYNYAVNIGTTLKRRNFSLISTMLYDSERMCYINVGKSASCYNELTKPKHKKTKPVMAEMLYGFTYYRISDNLTRFVHVAYIDLKLPKLFDQMFGQICIARTKAMQKGYLDVIRHVRENKIVANSKSHIRYGVIEEFKERYPSKTWEVDISE